MYYDEVLSENSYSTALSIQSHSPHNQPYFFPIFEHVALGIAYLGLDGRWLEMNENVCELTGYHRDELRQMTLYELTYPEDLESSLVHYQRLLNQEVPTYSLEKRYIRKNRTLVWINLTISLLRDNQQQPLWLIASIEDISARKQMEEERRDLLAREAFARIQSERVNEQLLVLQALPTWP